MRDGSIEKQDMFGSSTYIAKSSSGRQSSGSTPASPQHANESCYMSPK
jgi:hypothetical protein